MAVNFRLVYDDKNEQSGTISLCEVAELLAYWFRKHLIAPANRARIDGKTLAEKPSDK